MWVTWEQYNQLYPREAASMSKCDFDALAARAARELNNLTSYRARLASTDAERDVLAACQAELINAIRVADKEDTRRGGVGVQSANNDGYSATFVAASDVDATRERRKRDIIRQYLSAPETAWMIYAGGVYFRPGRW